MIKPPSNHNFPSFSIMFHHFPWFKPPCFHVFFSTTTYPPNPKPKTQTPGTKTPKASSPGAHLVEHQKGISRGKKSDNVKNMIDMETLCIYI